MRYLLLLLALPLLLGASAGPQVLDDLGQRRFARGPWVSSYESGETFALACNMTSDTCSDGRKITTTRSTPVPCEVSPGVWEMVPEDTGCYGVRGLESWAATTSYLSYGADLTKEVWEPLNDSTVEVLPDGFRVHPGVGRGNSGPRQAGVVPAVGEETRTLTCLVRTYAPAYIRYWMGNVVSASFSSVDTGGKWQVLSATRTLGDGDGTIVRIGGGPASEDPVPFDVAGCWLTRTSTPGRACWGGEAPVTCAADRHRISTEGWPTEAGEVSLVYTPGQAENASRFLISTSTFGVEGWEFYVRNADTMSFLVHNEGSTIYSSAPLTWEPRPYALRVRWGDGIVSFWRDGVLVGTSPMTRLPNGLKSTALIGSRDGSGQVNGSISSLRVRSFE